MDFLVICHCTINQSIMQSPTVSNNTNNTNMSSIVEVNVPLFNGLAAMNRAYGEEVIRACAMHFNFDAEAAISMFIKERQLEKAARVPKTKKEKVEKSKVEKPAVSTIPLPWTGEKREGLCTGLRLNHGLHTQCTMVPAKGGCYCKTCQKQADASANGKPTYGCVEDRLAVGLTEYRDPKGKQSTPYAAVMEKLNITRSDAEDEAAKIGITIPEELFEVRKLARGRPKKDASASDTDSSQSSQSSVKKGRGRPKKAAKAVESENGDDLISALVAKANSATPAAVVPQPTHGLTIDVAVASPQSSPPAVLPAVLPMASFAVSSFAAPPPAVPIAAIDTAALEAKKAKAADKRAAKKAKQEEEARQLALRKEEEARLAQIKKEAEQFPINQIDISRSPSAASSPAAATAPQNVTKVTRLGKEYLEQDGFLFDISTQVCVGYWDAETNKIEECDDDDDEE